jgi:ubiquinone/menaquinone biosynthesis C-methylase UbiE
MTDPWLSQLKSFFDARVKDLEMDPDEFALNGYQAAHQPSYWTEPVRKRLLDDVARKLELSPEHRVLDVGCGTGMILRRIAPQVASITGIDFCAGMLAVSRHNPMSNVSLLQANAAQLPFKDQVFDRVLCYFVIANFPDDDFTRRVLAQLIRVTRKGGVVLIGNTPDYEKKSEQAKLVQARRKSITEFSFYRSLWNWGTTRFRNILSYPIGNRSVRPNLGFRFYTKDFFKQFAKQASCEIEFLPLEVEGFIYAPYRFDVRLWPV